MTCVQKGFPNRCTLRLWFCFDEKNKITCYGFTGFTIVVSRNQNILHHSTVFIGFISDLTFIRPCSPLSFNHITQPIKKLGYKKPIG